MENTKIQEKKKINPKPVKWEIGGTVMDSITLEVVARPDGSDRFAIRNRGNCLNTDGLWEWEPSPSNRDDDFFKRCRFDSFEDAIKIAEKYL